MSLRFPIKVPVRVATVKLSVAAAQARLASRRILAAVLSMEKEEGNDVRKEGRSQFL